MPENLDRCVRRLKADGWSEDKAYAICNAAINNVVGGIPMLEWRRFVPITKVDEERRLVTGILAESAIDKSGEAMDYKKSKPHFVEWSEGFKKTTGGKSAGNLRVMHTHKVAGVFKSVEFDDENERIPVIAKIVDDDEWKMVLEGGYTGFSIGGRYGETETIDKVFHYEAIPNEGSLADNPCQYGATFEVHKADGAVMTKNFVGLQPYRFSDDHLAKLGTDGTLKKDDRPGFVTKLREVTGFANAADAYLRNLLEGYSLVEFTDGGYNVDDAFAAIDRILKAARSARGGGKAMRFTVKDGVYKFDGKEMKKVTVGEYIRTTREEKGLEVEALAAEVAGLNTEGLTAIENGEGEPTLDVLQQIAAALGVTVDELMMAPEGGDGDGDGGGDTPPTEPVAASIKTGDLKKLFESVLAQGEAIAKISEKFDESVKKTVESSLEKATADLRTTISEIETRLDKVAKSPAAVGRNVEGADKKLGHSDGGDGEGKVDLVEFGHLVDKMAKTGHLKGDDLLRIRRALALAAMPKRAEA